MQRRTLDILFSAGGMALAGLLLIVGLVMTSNANFAQSYVHDQLAEQKITFTKLSALKPEEKKAACLVKYAGQPLTTGKQAECYANSYIGLHVKEVKGLEGQTYASAGDVITGLKAQLTAAQAAPNPDGPQIVALNQQIADANTGRETLFKGESLRGLLLTSYGFSVLGLKGGQVAIVCYLVAGLLCLLSIAGFVHAFRTAKTVGFGVPERKGRKRPLHYEGANGEQHPARV